MTKFLRNYLTISINNDYKKVISKSKISSLLKFLAFFFSLQCTFEQTNQNLFLCLKNLHDQLVSATYLTWQEGDRQYPSLNALVHTLLITINETLQNVAKKCEQHKPMLTWNWCILQYFVSMLLLTIYMNPNQLYIVYGTLPIYNTVAGNISY